MHSLRHLLHRYILLSSLIFWYWIFKSSSTIYRFWCPIALNNLCDKWPFLLSRCFVGKVNPLWMDIGRQAQNFFCTVNFVVVVALNPTLVAFCSDGARSDNAARTRLYDPTVICLHCSSRHSSFQHVTITSPSSWILLRTARVCVRTRGNGVEENPINDKWAFHGRWQWPKSVWRVCWVWATCECWGWLRERAEWIRSSGLWGSAKWIRKQTVAAGYFSIK